MGSPAVLHLDGVGLTYPGEPPVEALKPAQLQVHDGDYLTIVGPSGSGKSTLLNVMGLLDRPTTGDYWLSGINTSTLGEDQRTAVRGRRIGFVFQSFHLLDHRTTTENVALAMLYTGVPAKERDERAIAVLEQVGLGHRLDALPAKMSGGERQRVAIARALVGQPALLLCDEPTGNLDSTNTVIVLELLDDLHNKGVTLIVITHDNDVAQRGSRTVTIRDGLLEELSR